MAALRERNEPLRLLGRRLLLALLAVLVISALGAVWNIYRKNAEAAQLRADAKGQLAALEAQQAKLQADYDSLSTGRGLEAALRQEYAVGKSGEGLIVIVEPDKPQPAASSTSPWQWIAGLLSHW